MDTAIPTSLTSRAQLFTIGLTSEMAAQLRFVAIKLFSAIPRRRVIWACAC